MDISLSDHRPVYALFEINTFDKKDERKRNSDDQIDRSKTSITNSKACIIY
jgi:hypothetical protein